MKLSEFILLNEADKKHVIMNEAAPLAQRRHGDTIIFLFQLEDYYVEAYCQTAGKNIVEYCILPDTNAICHYLEAIPIDGLLN